MHCLHLSELVCPTCGAALVDDGAQSLTHDEPQVRSFVNSHAQCAGDALKGCEQVDRTSTETREHGPNL